MGPLEDEVKRIVREETLKNPAAATGWEHGSQDVDSFTAITILADRLNGVEQAVYRLAREVDESRS